MVAVDPGKPSFLAADALPPTYSSALSMSKPRVAGNNFQGLKGNEAPTLSPSNTASSISTADATVADGEPTASAFCVPGAAALEGWLHKRHAHAKTFGSQWARRCASLLHTARRPRAPRGDAARPASS